MSGLVFLSPAVLWGLLALPFLWWLLRAVPPAARHLKFPAVRLLLGLNAREETPERMPFWLLVLRMFALGAAILAFADPVQNPQRTLSGNGPLLVLMDGGWASAPDWSTRVAAVQATLEQAGVSGRPVAFVSIAEGVPQGDGLLFGTAGKALGNLRGLAPRPWAPDRGALANWLSQTGEKFDTWWLSDGLAEGAKGGAELAGVLAAHGAVQIRTTGHEPLALAPLGLRDGQLGTAVLALPDSAARTVVLKLSGKAPNGAYVTLAQKQVHIAGGRSAVTFDLPLELANRVSSVRIAGERSAGALVLGGSDLRRRKVALIGPRSIEGPQLVSPLFYLQKALEPDAVLIHGDIAESLLAAPDVIVLADAGRLSDSSTQKLRDWVEKGGTLLRFAGPHLAASGIGRTIEDPLLPVRLRAGDRALGGVMSWTTPKHLQPFPANSPFAGLPIPPDVSVTQQVIARPGPDLAARTLAALEDGTPLVTARRIKQGRIVLFHVTANAEWSNLPLSGLFVQMLDRLSIGRGADAGGVTLAGRSWMAEHVLDGFGVLQTPQNPVPVSGERLEQPVGPDAPPGIYRAGDTGAAIDVMQDGARLLPLSLPAGMQVEVLDKAPAKSWKPALLLAALLALMLDIPATLWLTGRLRGGAVLPLLLALSFAPLWNPPRAQADDALALRAANETVLAYVHTGDAGLDRISAAGLRGLGRTLFQRTSIEPAAPVGVDVETDELAFFPLLYWPVSETTTALSEAASERVNRYLLNGGMILFDTRDAGTAAGGGPSRNARALQRLTASLDIPALEQVPKDHVLTRSFYLLKDFPGRWANAPVWVEVSQPLEGVRFATVNDGVSPVVIGGNDWAAAWAVDENNVPMFPIGRGLAGQRQREMARRFGVNLVMYVMTGNYKSDQVHIPQLLERLGE